MDMFQFRLGSHYFLKQDTGSDDSEMLEKEHYRVFSAKGKITFSLSPKHREQDNAYFYLFRVL